MEKLKVKMGKREHQVDVCVVGGGIAGMCAAIAAARHGAKVALVNDRPMLGGNASSEIRMWLCGARGLNNRETGIVEELCLENDYRNPTSNFSIWDSVTYEAARFQENLELFLNCSVNQAEMDGGRIRSVTGWQGTTQLWHTFLARIFLDCSGDSVLAPLTEADYRVGREARAEFGEDIEPETADRKTMGMSCLIQARETDHPVTYTPPKWAKRYPTAECFPKRLLGFTGLENFWWMELGGEDDSIRDTEQLRDELLAVAFGVWDHIKNRGSYGADNWELDWVGFLPGKRESRRYLGDHILTQNDVRSEGRFDDMVAYGGWSMDDHNPAGLRWPDSPNIFHPAPSPYGIPYRCLYSRNIANLMFAGRNISVTHAALSSTRVMFTCGTCGQAAGTAAAIAVRENTDPRGVYERHIRELQQTLMDDDCFLPWHARAVAPLSAKAHLTASEGVPENLRNGLDRPTPDGADGWHDNSWECAPGGFVEYAFDAPVTLHEARITFDSDLNRHGEGSCSHAIEKNCLSNYPLHTPPRRLPASLVKSFRLEGKIDGRWVALAERDDNARRMVRIPLTATVEAVRLIPLTTWGAPRCRLFAFEVR
ncbi:MAG: FAD-dependent oxidoreductase [Victivallales bacterium]|nr:FAD-dependent oxidoreductase [Victivallales bacterium]